MTILGGGGEMTPVGLPIAAALLSRATRNPDPAVVVLAPGVRSDPPNAGPAVALLAAAPDVGAVVPRVLGPDGSLAEAGARLGADGTLRSCGRGESPRRSEYRFRRPVDGSGYGCFAIRGELIGGLAIDPGCDDAGEVAAAVLRQVRQDGHAVVYEPAWSVTFPEGAAGPSQPEDSPGTVDRAPVSPAERILVVCADLSIRPSPWSDGGVQALIDALDADRCPGRVSVACAEGRGNEDAAARLQARGVEVETGPADWAAWFRRRAYRFSHLIVTDGGVASGLAGPALGSQPQAAKVLWTYALPFRGVEAMLPVTPLRERPGHEYVRATVEARTAEVVRLFDRVWSANPADQQHLSGLLGSPVPLVVRPVNPAAGRDDGHGERWGMAVLGAPGADMVAAHEDAAAAAVEEIFARIAPRLPDARLVVVADRPTPRLSRLAERAGVELVPPGPDGGVGALARARVVLAPYRHGLGGAAALWAAFSAGTPVVTTGHAARAFSLGALAAQASFAEPLDLVEPAWRLHHDAGAWDRYRAAQDAVIAEQHSRGRFQEVLRYHLLELGILPAPTESGRRPAAGLRLPEPAATGAWRPAEPWRMARPALRPTDRPGRAPASIPEGVDEVEGYRMWCRARGPTPTALSRLATELATVDYRPRISVIVPVYNTDADVLEAALASVRNQVYDNWELCIADDGSSRTETKAVLAQAATDPRVRIAYLPGQSGISGASNAALALASGDYITLLDHDDELKPHALAQVVRWLNADPRLDVIYSDEDKLNEAGELVSPFFKPDWSPNLLLSTNYVCHLLVVRKSLMDKVGGFRSGFDGSQDHDLVLRLTELTDRVGHIPEPLYSWRMVPGSAAAVPDAKPYAFEAAKKALREALVRRGQEGVVVDGDITGVYRTRYAVPGRPRVAIIIPTRDRVDLLRTCVDSIRTISSYDNYEIVVIDNESRERATVEYLASFSGRVIRYPAMFNYARMLNLAAHMVECDALLFLNNDTEVLAADWIDALLEHGMRPEVGAVGGRLYLPDGRPQHEGIIVGAMGTATNVDHAGFWGLGEMTRDASAVTGACTMIRPGVYWAVGGNDERLRVAYNDVDICLRIHQAGYQVVYTPYAKVLHLEGASRAGYEHVDDKVWFSTRWRQDEEPDPYYNPNFDRHRLFRLAL